ncbi:MAG TPA: radical SAM protein [Elusimicrobiota bacterium]|nr:radical SAM protein [Elusimicrobiota bacterium]
MKVFLIQAPLWGLEPPIGLAQLGAYLEQVGHEVSVFDVNIDLYHRRSKEHNLAWTAEQSTIWTDYDIYPTIMKSNKAYIQKQYLDPIATAGRAVVGFSINVCSFYASLMMAQMIKEANPEIMVVFGGQLFSVDDGWRNEAFKDGSVDAIVLGDGEHTFADLIQRYSNRQGYEDCPGVFLWRGQKIVFTGARPPVDLNTLPFANYSYFNWDVYVEDQYHRGDLLLMTTRGCIRQCLFCGYRSGWPGFRSMSGQRIFDEIVYQHRRMPSTSYLKFYDLLLNGDMNALTTLAEKLRGWKEKKFIWRDINCIIRPEMTEEACRALREAGCQDITFGIESGSQRVLNLMRKGQRVDVAEQVLRNVRRAGIQTLCNFMFGFPGETEADFQETLNFLKRNHDYISFIYPSYTMCLVEPASPMRHMKEELGIRGDHSMYWESSDGQNTYPVRLRRYKEFCQLVDVLKINRRDGHSVGSSFELIEWLNLADYYRHMKDYKKALECYTKYCTIDPHNEYVVKKMVQCSSELYPTS